MKNSKGYILYNGFWNAAEPPDPVLRLQRAGNERGVLLEPVPNTRLTAEIGDSISVSGLAADYALCWDKDVRLAKAMEACGLRLYNRAAAVEVCDDKAATHLALAGAGIPMPRTLVAPMTYVHMDAQGAEPFLRLSEEKLGFPMVVKECYGSLGGQVYLAHNGDELRRLSDTMGPKPFLTQEFVSQSAGEDIRLYVVGGKVAAAMHRRSRSDFRANIGQGGQGESYTPTADEAELALRCCRVLDLDFAGVDILWGENHTPLVCEVNSSAQMAGITACTGVDVAGIIVDHVLEQEKKRCLQTGTDA